MTYDEQPYEALVCRLMVFIYRLVNITDVMCDAAV